MSYLVYARKYRPVTFDKMIGQKHVVQTLKNAIKHDRIAQAYIFSGMRGVGKTTTARILAKALNCQQGPTPDPCNKCEFCTEINDDRSVDVLEIDGASNRGIDEVRSLREGVKYKPMSARYKIIIIDEVHMLTREAFNALLKTLEEPPPHTLFVFATTEFHKVPLTIVSRCQHFEFKKISQRELMNHLLDISKNEGITISARGLRMIADAAEGSVRDSQSILDQAVAFSGENVSDEDLKEILGNINRELLLEFSDAIVGGRADHIFSLVEKVIESGHDLRFFYKELILHFRNLLVVKSVEKPEELLAFNQQELLDLQDRIRETGAESLLRFLLALQQADQGLKFSSHPRIYLEATLVKLCHHQRILPIQDLVKELKDIKKRIGTAAPVGRASFRDPAGRADMPRDSVPREKKEPSGPASIPSPPTQAPVSAEPVQGKDNPSGKRAKDIDKALQDPAVKSFMDKFKARVLSVEPVTKGEDREKK
jgi:DNA polymerase-3 subunit gamma/tau